MPVQAHSVRIRHRRTSGPVKSIGLQPEGTCVGSNAWRRQVDGFAIRGVTQKKLCPSPPGAVYLMKSPELCRQAYESVHASSRARPETPRYRPCGGRGDRLVCARREGMQQAEIDFDRMLLWSKEHDGLRLLLKGQSSARVDASSGRTDDSTPPCHACPPLLRMRVQSAGFSCQQGRTSRDAFDRGEFFRSHRLLSDRESRGQPLGYTSLGHTDRAHPLSDPPLFARRAADHLNRSHFLDHPVPSSHGIGTPGPHIGRPRRG
jgi:hypothetical protein